ncbi:MULTISPECIES: hypothetical protein [Legionella]|uniref:Uncharacterized protein n=1 Tax=Legionella resiliens TaxID=2905958 RepID=A0ABS8X098_9GAMM|nr:MULTISPECIES: hypothetical protein [unclassified Legionella]MCE0723005.1 hypothetical protein [Legionella sp. 9fVS26]MCE3532158.1 hypothetical protein [Legionella sp. 8cVS16]QLZ68284.1 hypothetical protein FOLKNPGA_01062 [Legionella sp. PC1000]
MHEKNIQPQQIPKLISLTAEVIKKTNPHLFFTLYKNKDLPSQIEDQYVNPSIQTLVKEHENIYFANAKERKEVVNDRSFRIETNCFFKNGTGLAMTAVGSGIHLGIYYILRSAGASYSTTVTFLACIPVTIIVTACFSPCATILLAKGIARGITPSVPNEEIDLTDVVHDIESQKLKTSP